MADLWMRCFRCSNALAPLALRAYFRQVLLDNPWADAELPSLVLERDGQIAGFQGRMVRPMNFRGQTLRCAISTQLMVDPDRKLPFAALELMRAFLSGPQDFSFSDGATDRATRLWIQCGGEASRLLSMEWTRRLRPAQTFTVHLREHRRLNHLARTLHPVSGAIDALAVRLLPRLYHKPRARMERQACTAAELFSLAQQAMACAPLHPIYTPATYAWLLDRAAESVSFGALRKVIALDKNHQPVGGFVYYARPGEIARVLQIIALPGHAQGVLAELFRDAWEQDAAGITGQLDPLLVTNLSNSHAQFRCTNLGVLVHSTNRDLLNVIHRGDAFLTRLDGEWWMRFGIDRRGAWSAPTT